MQTEATVRKKIHSSWKFRICQKLTINLGENPCTKVEKRGQYKGKATQMKKKMIPRNRNKMNDVIICSD